MKTEEFLTRLDNVTEAGSGWKARCPAHDDQHGSLSVSEGTNGKIVLHCHAGCDTEAVVQALGLTLADLFPAPADPHFHPRRIVATYDYTDETGKLLFQTCRYDPKDFKQRRPDGQGGWIHNLKGVKPVLYRLPELLSAIGRGETVFVVEGEKDADRLASMGLTATTSPMGAGKWKPHYSEACTGANVVVIPDNDDPGRQHAQSVALSLQGKAQSVRVVTLPESLPTGKVKDVSDYFDHNGQLADLQALVDQAPLFTTPDRLDRATQYEAILSAQPDPYELISFAQLKKEIAAVQWSWKKWLPLGFLTFLIAPQGAGKSSMGMRLAQTYINGKEWPDGSLYTGATGSVLWLETEYSNALNLERADQWGITLDYLLTYRVSVRSSTPWLEAIRKAATREDLRFIVIDALRGLHNLDENDSRIHGILQPFAEIAEKYRIPVLVLHHTKKGDAKGLDAQRGSGAITGLTRVAWKLRCPDPNNATTRILEQDKNNIAQMPDPMGVFWGEGEYAPLKFGEAPKTIHSENTIDRAKEALIAYLKRPQPASEVLAYMRDLGYTESTTQRAKRALQCAVIKDPVQGTLWSLPYGETKL